MKANVHQGPVTIQTALSIVGAVDSDHLLRHLPAVDQESYKSRTQSSGCGQPQFYWIFKNIDFDRWHRTNGMEVLWLSGPADCRISDASSHIVDLAKERYPEGQHIEMQPVSNQSRFRLPTRITSSFGLPAALGELSIALHTSRVLWRQKRDWRLRWAPKVNVFLLYSMLLIRCGPHTGCKPGAHPFVWTKKLSVRTKELWQRVLWRWWGVMLLHFYCMGRGESL